MSYFMQSGTRFVAMPDKNSMLESLPIGSYQLETSLTGPFFSRIPDAEATGKVYGDAAKRAERILNTFNSRDRSTGVLLCGEKGSGKSLLARLISEKAREDHNMPVIFVKAGPSGDDIETLLNALDAPATVVFDEFEKNFSSGEQNGLLSLLDGTGATKHLFVFTANAAHKINEFMVNRPGRIYYSLKFDALSEDFIREYGTDMLNNPEWVEELVVVAQRIYRINFDMLKAIVEESNRYNESPMESVAWLNINTSEQTYSYNLSVLDPSGKVIGTGTTRGRVYGDLGYPEFTMSASDAIAEGSSLYGPYTTAVTSSQEILTEWEDYSDRHKAYYKNQYAAAKSGIITLSTDIDEYPVIDYKAKSGEAIIDAGEGYTITLSPVFTSYVPSYSGI